MALGECDPPKIWRIHQKFMRWERWNFSPKAEKLNCWCDGAISISAKGKIQQKMRNSRPNFDWSRSAMTPWSIINICDKILQRTQTHGAKISGSTKKAKLSSESNVAYAFGGSVKYRPHWSPLSRYTAENMTLWIIVCEYVTRRQIRTENSMAGILRYKTHQIFSGVWYGTFGSNFVFF